jgi:hypothetical protein
MMIPLLYGFPRGLASIIEKHPQMLFSRQAAANAAVSGPPTSHMIAGSVLIDSPCRAYSGNTTRSIVG